ncbi:DUF4241 domain-containing protein [Nonomuraea sp. NPDC048882]|uniref:DUF4241 domain-containing protein n=1 Tax=Nonomuraea sp. NPDC048882 TaxID=3154347 RepID=UPI00340E33C6
MVRILDRPAVSWELALLPGQDGRLLDDGEFSGFGVDTGMAASSTPPAATPAGTSPRSWRTCSSCTTPTPCRPRRRRRPSACRRSSRWQTTVARHPAPAPPPRPRSWRPTSARPWRTGTSVPGSGGEVG